MKAKNALSLALLNVNVNFMVLRLYRRFEQIPLGNLLSIGK